MAVEKVKLFTGGPEAVEVHTNRWLEENVDGNARRVISIQHSYSISPHGGGYCAVMIWYSENTGVKRDLTNDYFVQH